MAVERAPPGTGTQRDEQLNQGALALAIRLHLNVAVVSRLADTVFQ